MKVSKKLENIAHKELWETNIVGVALVNEDGKFIKVNPQFCEIVGYSGSELENKRFHDITHPDDVLADQEEVARLLNNPTKNEYMMTKRYLNKLGNSVWVLLKVNKITDKDGKFLIFLSQISTILHIKHFDDFPTEHIIKPEAEKRGFFLFFKDYSSYIAPILIAIGVIIGEVLRIILS